MCFTWDDAPTPAEVERRERLRFEIAERKRKKWKEALRSEHALKQLRAAERDAIAVLSYPKDRRDPALEGYFQDHLAIEAEPPRDGTSSLRKQSPSFSQGRRKSVQFAYTAAARPTETTTVPEVTDPSLGESDAPDDEGRSNQRVILIDSVAGKVYRGGDSSPQRRDSPPPPWTRTAIEAFHSPTTKELSGTFEPPRGADWNVSQEPPWVPPGANGVIVRDVPAVYRPSSSFRHLNTRKVDFDSDFSVDLNTLSSQTQRQSSALRRTVPDYDIEFDFFDGEQQQPSLPKAAATTNRLPDGEGQAPASPNGALYVITGAQEAVSTASLMKHGVYLRRIHTYHALFAVLWLALAAGLILLMQLLPKLSVCNGPYYIAGWIYLVVVDVVVMDSVCVGLLYAWRVLRADAGRGVAPSRELHPYDTEQRILVREGILELM